MVATLALAVGSLLLSRNADPPAALGEITPFTSDGGLKRLPQLSPDGEKVAYAWAGPAGDNWDIYVKPLGVGARPIRLTEDRASDRISAWSPDGRQIAFVRELEDGPALFIVPSLGGQEQKLTDIGSVADLSLPILAWAPNGDWLALACRSSEEEPFRIVKLSLATLDKEPLTFPPKETLGDVQLALSPDGSHLAFVRFENNIADPGEVWVRPIGRGTPRRITPMGFSSFSPGYHGLAWMPDDSGIVLTAVTTDRPRMFHIPLFGGKPQPVVGIGQDARYPSIRGRRMVYEQWRPTRFDIWRVPGRKGPPDQVPQPLIVSSRTDAGPDYSPDGRKIAFSSLRSGVANVWLCNSDGSNPVQLTDFAKETGMPRWSPDGGSIVFDSVAAGDSNLYLIDAAGGVPRRLTPEPSNDFNPSWSRDSRSVYFTSDRSGSRQIWKIPSEGGPAAQVTHHGGFQAEESWDGRFLYYSKGYRSGVFRMPVEGGDETTAVSGPLSLRAWAVARDGIYFAEAQSLGGVSQAYALQYLDIESGEISELFRKEGPFRHARLEVSPGEEWILHGERPTFQSELMLVENFR